MKNNSKVIITNQPGVHENLLKNTDKYLSSEYKKPVQEHNAQAFDELKRFIQLSASRFSQRILDSCCGTGLSSIKLASMNPDAMVIAVDQSAVRLTRLINEGVKIPDNVLFLRANCEDIWRLCRDESLLFDKHYILYPNPWPKSVHLKRRWHGHPVFPVLPQLADQTIVRSNWKLYLEEFAIAWERVTGKRFAVQPLAVEEPLTRFEEKYHASGQALYELVVN